MEYVVHREKRLLRNFSDIYFTGKLSFAAKEREDGVKNALHLLVEKHWVVMPPKLNRFNVGLFNKIKKQKKDAALQENTKLMNCLAEESRKLKSTQMKLKRLQAMIFISIFICLFIC